MDKVSLRKFYRKRRDSLLNQPEAFAKACRLLAGNIHQFLAEVPAGSLIFGYRATGSEAPLPWVEGFRWSYPKITGASEMDFHEVPHLENFVSGPWGILEPQVIEGSLSTAGHAQAILVPGISFDQEGFRLGGGKGFYDRFLAPLKGALRVGIGFQAQVHHGLLPRDPWDMSLDWLITEKNIVGFSRRKQK